MRIPRRILVALSACVVVLSLTPSAQAALANRVFMSTNGNDSNNCANPNTPCLTFAGSLAQVAVGGEVIAEATGGYGAINVTQSVTISGPPGVVIYSGSTVTVNAPGATVVLRGLTIDGTGTPTGSGINVVAVGTLNVENCFISGFSAGAGIGMGTAGNLNIKNTDARACLVGVAIVNSSGTVIASIDRCHLDGNTNGGWASGTTGTGGSKTTATNSTANNTSGRGWTAGGGGSGNDVLNLEFCSGSGNAGDGVRAENATVRYSNCVFSNNGGYGIYNNGAATFESRGNNTITGNTSGATFGAMGSFSPM